MKITLRVERLVLDGLPLESSQGQLVKAAVEAELSRLIADQGISSELMAGGSVSAISTNSIQVAHDIGPSNLGRQIAKSIYGGIGR